MSYTGTDGPAGYYETVAISQSNQVMGGNGNRGDYIEQVICVVATAATAQVQIKDGANTAFTILPNSPGGGVGTYIIPLKMYSTNGAWQVTTAAGVTAVVIGRFT